MEDQEPQAEVETNPLQEVLRVLHLRDGQMLAELHDYISGVLGQIKRTGKAGEVTLRIAFSPAAAGDDTVVGVKWLISSKLPPTDHGVTVMFATGDDRLLMRTDPRQADFFSQRPSVVAPRRIADDAIPAATRVTDADRLTTQGGTS